MQTRCLLISMSHLDFLWYFLIVRVLDALQNERRLLLIRIFDCIARPLRQIVLTGLRQ